MHKTARKFELPVYDSAEPGRGLSGFVMDRVGRAFGLEHTKPNPPPAQSGFPPLPGKLVGRQMWHWGIMIPGLPAPHYFLANMGLTGLSGMLNSRKGVHGGLRNTARLGHGTAATTHTPLTTYSIKDETTFSADGTKIQLGDDFFFDYGVPKGHLRTHREDFSADLDLIPTGEVTLFAESPIYRHLSVLLRVEGIVRHKGVESPVSTLGTFEHAAYPGILSWSPVWPGWLRNRLPSFFTYHVINLDERKQITLCVIGGMTKRNPICVIAFTREVGGELRRFVHNNRFEVFSLQGEPVLNSDGVPVRFPDRFRWTIRDGAKEFAVIDGTVNTPLLAGVGPGHIGGYEYQATVDGHPYQGLGYMEYLDHGRWR
ncbi:DUF6670 family protein [Mycobacteroides salmoniphilum]|uniref:DUF6670 family protein n=1 Tax=Mycobacteroides salmoniphilum TaxID=404941 RepID=UPI00106692A6|nr:DUF6670 family protein [Mycobacteroides salmoniphilum]TDZ76884.1 hypothetical protein DE4586_02670 [Mycobacteroides salmoniphilum]TDZ86587.1 hypothetical protein DE4587_01974 [Mycobacteroides salmoniphilum]